MTRPGDRLRRIAARFVSAPAMDRLIDPVISDLQVEHNDAVRQGRLWKSRWVRCAGVVALLKVLTLHGCARAVGDIRNGAPDDHLALGRTIGYSAAAVMVATLVLAARPLVDVASLIHVGRVTLLVMLAPQALPIAMPMGLMVGILFGLRQRAVSRRLKVAILAIGIGCSIGSYPFLAWFGPAANQAFRASVSGQPRLMKGPAELTIDELRQEMKVPERTGVSTSFAARMYYTRWALVPATSVLALFALAMVTRRRSGRLLVGLAGCGAVVIYYALLNAADTWARDGTVPAFTVAWLPNVAVVALAMALLLTSTTTRQPTAPTA